MASKPNLTVPLTLKLRAKTARKITKPGAGAHYVVTTTLADVCNALFSIDRTVASFLELQVRALAAAKPKKNKIGFNCPGSDHQR